jgi:phage terminase small subunit
MAKPKAKMGGKRGVKKNAVDLSIKERVFVREYLKDENGTRSVIAAGWAPKSAAVTASKLLKLPKIQAELAKVSDKVCDDLEVSVGEIVRELRRMAFVNPKKFFEDDGSVKQISEMDDATAACIAGIEVTELFEGKDVPDGPQQKTVYGLLKKFKFADKIRACELLGRYKKMYTEKVEHSGTVTLEQLVAGEND